MFVSQRPILDNSLDNSPRSQHHAPRTGVTDAACWPRSSLRLEGQGFWAGVLGPRVLGLDGLIEFELGNPGWDFPDKVQTLLMQMLVAQQTVFYQK